MMLYPAMNKLTEYIPNRYMMVNVVARRARQIAEEAEATGQHLDEKPVTLAIHEVAEGKFDAHTKAVVTAFQRHWRQEKVDGIADGETRARLIGLLRLGA